MLWVEEVEKCTIELQNTTTGERWWMGDKLKYGCFFIFFFALRCLCRSGFGMFMFMIVYDREKLFRYGAK